MVYDTDSPLSRLLATAYQALLPPEACLDFNVVGAQAVLEIIKKLPRGSLVILVQSASFRLDMFRIRLHLFEWGHKVIEHPHLQRIHEEEFSTYIQSLDYDRDYYQHVGYTLKKLIDLAREIRLEYGAHVLTYDGPFEPTLLNIGDYSNLKNIGGQFPIGEVFSEAFDLKKVNGEAALFAFGAMDFSVVDCQDPIILQIKEGRIEGALKASQRFLDILEAIKNRESCVWVRELGFGLNRAMNRERRIANDVGTFERMCGIHLSLGAKHTVYTKEGFSKKKAKFHVDVFAATDRVVIDDRVVFENNAYCV